MTPMFSFSQLKRTVIRSLILPLDWEFKSTVKSDDKLTIGSHLKFIFGSPLGFAF